MNPIDDIIDRARSAPKRIVLPEGDDQRAIGPILQGLNSPANDLSRGCGVDDVYNAIAVTVVQAQSTDDRRQE